VRRFTVVINKWTGSWSRCKSVATEKINFAGNYTANTDVVACSCECYLEYLLLATGIKVNTTNDLKVTGGNF
jgi:hypothetical protein